MLVAVSRRGYSRVEIKPTDNKKMQRMISALSPASVNLFICK